MSPQGNGLLITPGFLALSSAGYQNYVHTINASYTAYILEQGDMLSVKGDSMTNTPCYRYQVLTTEHALERSCREWSAFYPSQLLSSTRAGYFSSGKVCEHSVQPNRSRLASLPFMSKYTNVDIYRVFCFESIEFLNLTISKRLQECLVSLIKYKSRVRATTITLERVENRSIRCEKQFWID